MFQSLVGRLQTFIPYLDGKRVVAVFQSLVGRLQTSTRPGMGMPW